MISTVFGVFLGCTSTTVYWNLYVFSFPRASLTTTFASRVPSGAVISTTLSCEIWYVASAEPFCIVPSLAKSLLPCLLNHTPLGILFTLRYVVAPELSLTTNVGLNVEPRYTTKRFAAAFSVNAFPFIVTVGASVSRATTSYLK